MREKKRMATIRAEKNRTNNKHNKHNNTSNTTNIDQLKFRYSIDFY
jgi:hypothetical protein